MIETLTLTPENASTVGVILGAAGASALAAWRATRGRVRQEHERKRMEYENTGRDRRCSQDVRFVAVEKRLGKVENRVGVLETKSDSVLEWVRNINAKLGATAEDLSETKDSIADIRVSLARMSGRDEERDRTPPLR